MRYTGGVFVASVTAFAIMSSGACNKSDTSTKTDSTTTPVATAAPPSEERFSATMNGQSERPKPVNTTATGSADFTLTSNGAISYTITVNGLSSNPTGAHIHGPADTSSAAGPIVTFDSISKTMT